MIENDQRSQKLNNEQKELLDRYVLTGLSGFGLRIPFDTAIQFFHDFVSQNILVDGFDNWRKNEAIAVGSAIAQYPGDCFYLPDALKDNDSVKENQSLILDRLENFQSNVPPKYVTFSFFDREISKYVYRAERLIPYPKKKNPPYPEGTK